MRSCRRVSGRAKRRFAIPGCAPGWSRRTSTAGQARHPFRWRLFPQGRTAFACNQCRRERAAASLKPALPIDPASCQCPLEANWSCTARIAIPSVFDLRSLTLFPCSSALRYTRIAMTTNRAGESDRAPLCRRTRRHRRRTEAMKAFSCAALRLESGEVARRLARPASPTGWRVNAWVKQGILLGFRLGVAGRAACRRPFLRRQAHLPGAAFHFRRRRAHGSRRLFRPCRRLLARGVICMPPMYINAGA